MFSCDIAREAGIHPILLYQWKIEYASDPEQAFPGKSRIKPDGMDLQHLKRELAQAREERLIM